MRYRGRCHSDIVTISECPLEYYEIFLLEEKISPFNFFSITLLRFAFLFIFSLVDLLELASRMEEI